MKKIMKNKIKIHLGYTYLTRTELIQCAYTLIKRGAFHGKKAITTEARNRITAEGWCNFFEPYIEEVIIKAEQPNPQLIQAAKVVDRIWPELKLGRPSKKGKSL